MSQILTCPNCSKRLRVSEQITDKTSICPHCLANVDNAWAGSQLRANDINTDVKRDADMGCIVLAVLIGFCVLGIAMAWGRKRPLQENIGLFFCPCIALLPLVFIAIIRGLVRRGLSGARVSNVENAFGCIFLVLGSISAAIIFTFVACAMHPIQWGK